MTVRDSAILVNATYVAGEIIGKDGNQISKIENENQLVLYVDFTIGSLTSAEVKIEFAPALYYNLAYDAQTANFTVGETVKGQTTGTEGKIIADTDGGATGTLVIARQNGVGFADNEIITDSNSTPGSATVNGAMTFADSSLSTYNWFQETSSAVAGAISTESTVEHQFIASGKYRIAVPLKDKFIRVSAQGTGTATSSLMRIEAVVGTV